MDIRLPCGGGLDVLLHPRPALDLLAEIATCRNRRETVHIAINKTSGTLHRIASTHPSETCGDFILTLKPPIQFHVFGIGVEAVQFTRLTNAAGFPAQLYTPDPPTRETAAQFGMEARNLGRGGLPDVAKIDRRSALVLFFHEHDWEPPILYDALKSDAFYIGAQGSRRTQAHRLRALEELGIKAPALARLRGPIGNIPSTRDPNTLAISVLGEVMQVAGEQLD